MVQVKIALFVGLSLLFCGANAARLGGAAVAKQGGNAVFDVTKFGAKADGKCNDAMAFVKAWVKACNAKGGKSSVLVPPGKYMTGEIVFVGPCTSAVTIELQGEVTALADMSEFADAAWISVENVDNFTLDGRDKGSLRGNGQSVWKYDVCKGLLDSDCMYHALPPTLRLSNVSNADIGHFSSFDSKGYHIRLMDSKNVNIHNLKLQAPESSTGTNGVVATFSKDIKVDNSSIQVGKGHRCMIFGESTTGFTSQGVTCHA